MWVLYDLAKRQHGPTSDRYGLLRSYQWARHDPEDCAVLPVMPGFLLQVSRKAANAARRERGMEEIND